MKNLFLVLIGIAYTMSAHAEGYSRSLGSSLSEGRDGGVKDGRGVGGGYGGHVKDLFLGLSLDLIEIAGSSYEKQNNDEKAYSRLSPHPHEQNNLEIDAEKILDFVKQGKLRVVQDGDVYAPLGVSYNIVDGAIYLNAAIWEKKLMQGDCELEIIRLLLSATNQADEGGKVSKHYADIIKAEKLKNSPLDIQIKPKKIFE